MFSVSLKKTVTRGNYLPFRDRTVAVHNGLLQTINLHYQSKAISPPPPLLSQCIATGFIYCDVPSCSILSIGHRGSWPSADE